MVIVIVMVMVMVMVMVKFNVFLTRLTFGV